MESLRRLLLSLAAALLLAGCMHVPSASSTAPSFAAASAAAETVSAAPTAAGSSEAAIAEDEICDSKDEVALYLETYWHLPSNYMTKQDARAQGWEGGALSRVIPGKCIGGDVYSNYEGTLPEKKGRTYYECDIDTLGKKKRGARRIIWSSDHLIYYTSDHYDTFTLLYGEADS
jgi:guanyl-specific ribonuclease Sa